MIQFPLNPVLGQEYSQGEKTWKWKGFAWDLIALPSAQVEETKAAAAEALRDASSALANARAAALSSTASSTSQLAALASENAAELAEAGAVAARDLTVAAKEAAQAIVIQTGLDAVATAADRADVSAKQALVAIAAVTATDAATLASAASTDALTASALATAYAIKMDGPVANGLYSALYYSEEAKRSVDSIIVGQVQANWNETDTAAKGYIANKPVLFNGTYAALSGKPSIPTNTSELTNGANFVTAAGARAALSVTGALTYNAATGAIGYVAPVLATVASSGSYADLSNKPTIPATLGQLTNDVGFITSAGARTAISVSGDLTYDSTTGVIGYVSPTAANLAAVAFSGSYVDLLNKPVIPTNTNQLTNGASFITLADARAAISVTGDLVYSATTGVLNYTAPIAPVLAPVATSGSYTDLTSKPTLFSGVYADLANKPSIPTDTAQLTNSAGFITSAQVPAGGVTSVAGRNGVVTLSPTDVGLANVDNTSDLNKPVSTAQATAIAAKEPVLASGTTAQYFNGIKALVDFNTSVRAATLTGINTTSTSSVSSSDTALAGFGKLQGQVNARAPISTAQLTGKTKVDALENTVIARGNVSGTQTIDLSVQTEVTLTPTAAITFAFSNAPATNRSQVVYLRITNGGAYTISWPASTKFGGGSLGSLTASGVDLLAVKWDSTTSTYMVFVVKKDIR